MERQGGGEGRGVVNSGVGIITGLFMEGKTREGLVHVGRITGGAEGKIGILANAWILEA